jgi:acetyl esterase/lipase
MADLEMTEGDVNVTAETLLLAEKERVSWWEWLGFSKQTPKFTKLSDIEYPSLSGLRDPKHKLDIYIPHENAAATAERTKKPVLIHIHGGGWVRGTPRGNRRSCVFNRFSR